MRMTDVATDAFSHLGICVSDLERSKRFYCEGLGFEHLATRRVGNYASPGIEVAGELDLQTCFHQRQDLIIELLAWDTPGAEGTPSNRRNLLGITHLSFQVPDVDGTAKRLAECGGSIV